jgi:hypothetical protein
MGVNTVCPQALADPDGNGADDCLDVPNGELPVRESLLMPEPSGRWLDTCGFPNPVYGVASELPTPVSA